MTEVRPVEPIDLRAARLRRGLSASKVGQKIEVSEDVILWAERTGRRPRPEHALKIARFYGLDPVIQWPIDPTTAEAAA